MARLVIFDDSVRGLELPNRPVLIGRSKKNDVPINDSLLSRKHCSVVPMGSRYRLLDLRSSNGTYLNGKRIEKVDLAVDDIIEIGNTVMVFLEDGVWNRGEGLAQLRNPLKAQELIGRIKLHHRSRKGQGRIPLVAIESQPAKGAPERAGRRSKRPGRKPAAAVPADLSDFADELENFITHRALFILSRDSVPLRRLINEVLREALAGPAGPSGETSSSGAPDEPGALRRRIRASLAARLAGGARSGKAASSPDASEVGSSGSG